MKQAYKFIVCYDGMQKAKCLYVVDDYIPFTDSNDVDSVRLFFCDCYSTDFTTWVGRTGVDKFYARHLYRVKQSYK